MCSDLKINIPGGWFLCFIPTIMVLFFLIGCWVGGVPIDELLFPASTSKWFFSAILLLVIYASRSIIVVDANHVCVLFKPNGKTKILTHGLHFVAHPMARVKGLDWHCEVKNQHALNKGCEHKNDDRSISKKSVATDAIRSIVHRSNQIPITNQSLGVISTTGYSKDGVELALDGALHYKITNAITAVTDVQNLFQFLIDAAESATSITLPEFSYFDATNNRIYVIPQSMTNQINVLIGSSGVACVKYVVLSIRPKNFGQIEYEAEMEKSRVLSAEHKNKTMERELTKVKFDLEQETEKQRHDLFVSKRENETKEVLSDIDFYRLLKKKKKIIERTERIPKTLKQEERQKTIAHYLEAGFDHEQIVRIENLRISAEKNKNAMIRIYEANRR